MSYSSFAEFYDLFMQSAEYKKRNEYVLSLFEKYDRLPSLLLDLGCGTGTFSKLMSEASVDVIGVDPSEDMLLIAREKCPDVLFLNQSGEELDLYGTVDGAISLMDSLNHITDYEAFKKAIRNVSLFLEKDRLFIFDMNTEYKHETILGNNAFTFENDDVFCAWQNYTDESLFTEQYLDFFKKTESGEYLRFSDEVFERAYSLDEIKDALQDAGFKLLEIFDDLSFSRPTEKSERLYFIAKKVK